MYVPATVYVCDGLGSVLVSPSPKSQRYVSASPSGSEEPVPSKEIVATPMTPLRPARIRRRRTVHVVHRDHRVVDVPVPPLPSVPWNVTV